MIVLRTRTKVKKKRGIIHILKHFPPGFFKDEPKDSLFYPARRMGGVTVYGLFNEFSGIMTMTWARCRRTDVFKKKWGREIAEDRMNLLLKGKHRQNLDYLNLVVKGNYRKAFHDSCEKLIVSNFDLSNLRYNQLVDECIVA